MKITKVSYEKVFNLGNYENEKIRLDIDLAEGESVQDALAKARTFIDLNSQPVKQKVAQAEEVLRTPDDFTGRQVKQAQDALNEYGKRMAELQGNLLTA